MSLTPDATPAAGDTGWRTIERFDNVASIQPWQPRNDDIMGGRSAGTISFDDEPHGPAMVFAGELNLDGGGFASIRRDVEAAALEGARLVRVRARTDGRHYRLSLKDSLDREIERVSHQAVLDFSDADENGVATAIVDLSELETKRRGRPVTAEQFRPELASSLGIMITDDREDPFHLAVVDIAVR